MQEWACRLCFLLSQAHEYTPRMSGKEPLYRFKALHRGVVWMVISACLESQTSLKQVLHLLRRKPPSTVCAGRLPVLQTWRTSADCLRRPRVNTDVENGGGTSKALTGKTDDGCHDEPSQGEWPGWGSGRPTGDKNTSKAAEHRWKINFGVCDCSSACLSICWHVSNMWRRSIKRRAPLLSQRCSVCWFCSPLTLVSSCYSV